MPLKRSTSKDTTKRSTSEVIESILITKQIFWDTQLFIEKYSYITWHTVKDAFTTTNYKAYLEDKQVYINVLE